MRSITKIEILQGDWPKTVEYYYHNIILRENCDNYKVSIDIKKNYNIVYTIDMAGRERYKFAAKNPRACPWQQSVSGIKAWQ